MKTVAFHTLGCKLNFSETSTIARMMVDSGYKKVEFETGADVYVINTCSVTDNADKECKQIVRSALNKSPEAVVAIIGCYAQLKPQEIAKIEGVDLVLGATEKFKLIDYLNDLSKTQEAKIFSCEIENVNSFIDSYSIGDRTRAFLKVQDGCDYTCAFCTIPLARGKSRSSTVASIFNNAVKITNKDIKEIVLTGVNIGDFGKGVHPQKKHDETFYDLIKKLDTINEIERFRISSIEPNLLHDDIIEFVSTSRKFAPHFHIPLQSGCNKTLKAMRRRYLRELYAERINKIKSLMPHCCIGVDVIVGFPGETDEDFIESYNFIQSLDISYLHVFTYSERDNTDALEIKPVIPVTIRKQRNKMLRILSVKKQQHFYEQHLNSNRIVLFESENKNGFIYGYTDNYIKVKTLFNPNLINHIAQAHLTAVNDEGCVDIDNIKLISTNTNAAHSLAKA